MRQHRFKFLSVFGLGVVFACYFAFAFLMDDTPEVHAVEFTVEQSRMIERDLMNKHEPFLIIETTDGETYEMKNFDFFDLYPGERWSAEVWEADGQIMKYPRIRLDSMRRISD